RAVRRVGRLVALGNRGGGGSAALAALATSVGDGPAGLVADERDFGLSLDALTDIAYNTVR
ncbi:MAG: hypothetical protein ACRDPA_21935, partial [Solirubrobacteraceae bacterium]